MELTMRETSAKYLARLVVIAFAGFALFCAFFLLARSDPRGAFALCAMGGRGDLDRINFFIDRKRIEGVDFFYEMVAGHQEYGIVIVHPFPLLLPNKRFSHIGHDEGVVVKVEGEEVLFNISLQAGSGDLYSIHGVRLGSGRGEVEDETRAVYSRDNSIVSFEIDSPRLGFISNKKFVRC